MNTGCPGDPEACGSAIPSSRDPPKPAQSDNNGGNDGPAGKEDDSGISGTIWIIIAIAAVLIIGGTLYMVRRNKLRSDANMHPQDDLGDHNNPENMHM